MGEAYNRLMAEHRRLSILRALEDTQIGPECNDSILHDIVVREYGLHSDCMFSLSKFTKMLELMSE